MLPNAFLALSPKLKPPNSGIFSPDDVVRNFYAGLPLAGLPEIILPIVLPGVMLKLFVN